MSSSADLVTDLTLADGRRIEYRVSGPDDGLPLIFHHGTPGSSSRTLRVFERAAHARGLRYVAASRPGYAGSDRHEGRHVVDVVADTEALLDAIDSTECVVAGWSGGGPHALACAARLEAAKAVLVIAGLAPFDADGLDWMAGMGQDNIDEFGAAIAGPDVFRDALEPAAPALRAVTADGIVASFESLLPPSDLAVLDDEFGEDLAHSFHDALRVGVDGWLDDGLAFVHPWGFDLAEIDTPVTLWHGSDDLMVPVGHGEWMATHITDVDRHLLDGEGHLSVTLGQADQMLDALRALA